MSLFSIYKSFVATAIKEIGSMGSSEAMMGAGWMPVIGGSQGQYTQEQALVSYEEVGWLYAAVSRIAQSFAETMWKLYLRKRNGDKEEIQQHDFLTLLNDANPFQTGQELRELSSLYMDLLGLSYWVLLPNKRAPSIIEEIWTPNPTLIRPIRDKEHYIAGYILSAGGEQRFLKQESVITFRQPHPRNPIGGLSAVSAISADLDAEKFTARWNRNFFKNSALPGGVIEVPEGLTDTQFEHLQTQWGEGHQGLSNVGKVGILEAGMKFHEMITTQRDMQFKDLRKANRDIILGAFGLPLHILGISEDVNRANADAAEYVFSRWVIRPRLVRFREKLNERLLPLWGKDLMLDFVDPTPENRELNLQIATEGFGKGLLDRDEARAILGFDPADIKQTFYVPAINIPETGGVTSPQMEGLAARTIEQKQVIRTEADTKRWSAFEKRLTPSEIEMRDWVQGLFIAQEREVLGRLGNKAINRKQEAGDLFDTEEWIKETAAGARPFIRDRFIDEAIVMSTELGDIFDITNPRVERWLGQRLRQFSKDINQTTLDAIVDQLKQGHALGEGIPEIRKRIQGVFENASRYRATMIARTEMVAASNQGLIEAFTQAELEEYRWLTAEDERVDEICGENEEVGAIGLGEAFPSGDDAPPAHPNCRCVLIPVITIPKMLKEARCPTCDKLLAKDVVTAKLFCIRCKSEIIIRRGVLTNPRNRL